MKDLFSDHSKQYAQFRPTYPRELFDFIYSHVHTFNIAWDSGTGNGQSAYVLSKTFKKVWATDISAQQIEEAPQAENIFYSVGGERTTFEDHSIDLITVAQAIHWFNLPDFYKEVNRVSKVDSLLAVWGYGLLSIDSVIDPLIQNFYKNVVGEYWDKERKFIDEHYITIQFPFKEIETPEFNFSFDWTIDQLEGYLNTWSAVRKYIKAINRNPVTEFTQQVKPHWKQNKMKVTFPLFLRLGQVNPQ